MASTYSTNLAIELIGTGEQSGTWGVTTNTNLGTLLEQAISGYVTQAITDGADTTITIPNGATGVARNMFIEMTGALTAARNLVVPANKKLYFIYNNTTGGFAVTVKVSGQTGVSVPNGKKVILVSNGTDIVNAENYIASLSVGALTSGRVPYASTAGLLVDSANLLYSGTDLTVYGLTVGRGAGAVNGNTAVGASALSGNTTGSDNTGIGFSALAAQTTGTGNTALGLRAAYQGTAFTNVVAIGANALSANTASDNTAVGTGAAIANTSGTNNTVFGRAAFSTNTTGGSNTAVGHQALQANTTASSNTAVGYQASYSNTTGYYNAAVGYQALYSTTTGGNNVAVGYQAIYSGADVSNTTAIGYQALYTQATGNIGNNTGVGYRSLYSVTSANNVTAVGFRSGYSITSGAGSTMLGLEAGYTATTGTYNTFVGHQSGYYVSTGSKNTILGLYNGNQGGLDIRTASNYIVLSDGDGNPRAYWNGANAVFNGSLSVRTTATACGTKTTYFVTDIQNAAVYGAGIDNVRNTNDSGGLLVRRYESSGTSYMATFFNSSSSNIGNITCDNSSTSYGTSSDYRLKDNVLPMTGALDKVALLKPVTYKWKSDGSDAEGFIAHELAEVCPQAVHGEKDAIDSKNNPVYQSVDTSFLVATLVSAIQELTAKVNALESQLNQGA